jgi:hypothetical protein
MGGEREGYLLNAHVIISSMIVSAAESTGRTVQSAVFTWR